jgi:hypothetical protein
MAPVGQPVVGTGALTRAMRGAPSEVIATES